VRRLISKRDANVVGRREKLCKPERVLHLTKEKSLRGGFLWRDMGEKQRKRLDERCANAKEEPCEAAVQEKKLRVESKPLRSGCRKLAAQAEKFRVGRNPKRNDFALFDLDHQAHQLPKSILLTCMLDNRS
jgi:hypothetical protein